MTHAPASGNAFFKEAKRCRCNFRIEPQLPLRLLRPHSPMKRFSVCKKHGVSSIIWDSPSLRQRFLRRSASNVYREGVETVELLSKVLLSMGEQCVHNHICRRNLGRRLKSVYRLYNS